MEKGFLSTLSKFLTKLANRHIANVETHTNAHTNLWMYKLVTHVVRTTHAHKHIVCNDVKVITSITDKNVENPDEIETAYSIRETELKIPMSLSRTDIYTE